MTNILPAILLYTEANFRIQMYAVVALGVIPAICTSLAVAVVSTKIFEHSARQPDLFEKFKDMFFIMSSLIDALPLISVAIAFIVLFVNPASKDIAAILEMTSKHIII
jgi:ATP synthase F0 subunit c